MKRRLLRLVLAVSLPLAVCSCAGRSVPVPEVVEWHEDEVDAAVFVSFHTVIVDTLASPADLPPAGTCNGKYYVTGEGKEVALWYAIGGTWVQIAPQREVE